MKSDPFLLGTGVKVTAVVDGDKVNVTCSSQEKADKKDWFGLYRRVFF